MFFCFVMTISWSFTFSSVFWSAVFWSATAVVSCVKTHFWALSESLGMFRQLIKCIQQKRMRKPIHYLQLSFCESLQAISCAMVNLWIRTRIYTSMYCMKYSVCVMFLLLGKAVKCVWYLHLFFLAKRNRHISECVFLYQFKGLCSRVWNKFLSTRQWKFNLMKSIKKLYKPNKKVWNNRTEY